MTDRFVRVPDALLGQLVPTQEAIEWLAFGSPALGIRARTSLDDQIRCLHKAAGRFLLSLWDGGLLAHVQSPTSERWYSVPACYWEQPSSEQMVEVMNKPDVPTVLPGLPRPLDPRYGIQVFQYRKPMPEADLVNEALVFRVVDLERDIAVAKPVVQWEGCAIPPPVTTAPVIKRFDRWTRHDDLVAWYKARIEGAPAHGFSRDQDEIAGREVGIGRTRLRDLRREHAPKHWHDDGPKKPGG